MHLGQELYLKKPHSESLSLWQTSIVKGKFLAPCYQNPRSFLHTLTFNLQKTCAVKSQINTQIKSINFLEECGLLEHQTNPISPLTSITPVSSDPMIKPLSSMEEFQCQICTLLFIIGLSYIHSQVNVIRA